MNPGPTLRRCCWFSILLLALQTTELQSAETGASGPAPYPTGSHFQLVREFFTVAGGLPADEIRAVAVTRDGIVLVTAGKGVARLESERWVEQTGPAEVTALFAPVQGPNALAGATNGVWALNNGQWQIEAGSPADVIGFAAEPDGAPWALAPSGVWRRGDTWKLIHVVEDDQMKDPRSFLPTGQEEVFVASATGLYGLMGKRKYWLDLEVRPGELLSTDTRALARLDRQHFLVATGKGLNLTDGQRGWHSFTGAEGLPILDLTGVAVAPDGTVWLGSDHGLVRWKDGRWTYLASKRWLPDNRIIAIAPAADGSVWVGTPKGLAHLLHRKLTLADKAAILQKDLESRDRRHGYVTIMHLQSPGVLEGAMQEISDNDGLWTALYIASQSFRHAATKSPEARAQASRSMKALLRLESITGISGFPARAIYQVNEPQFARPSLRSDSEWHESPVEKDWYWKGETSSDELDGHYLGWYLFYELAANEEEKSAVRATCKRVSDHILDHGYHLVDKDGKPTTWGEWSPEKLNDDPKWWAERGLGSLEILSHLKVAARIVGEPRYEQAYQELIQKHHYAINTLNAKLPNGVSHDDQLLFLSYYPLLQLERDPALRALYIASLRRTWNMERIEDNPLWNFIFGASTGESCDVEQAVETLREMPLDFITWRTQNSHRADLNLADAPDRRGRGRAIKPLPWAERVISHWDHDPYELDGGSDLGEADQTVWLLPYWMGRYHGLID
jgi:hypothetical protein